jgi:hypothetical protein
MHLKTHQNIVKYRKLAAQPIKIYQMLQHVLTPIELKFCNPNKITSYLARLLVYKYYK